MKHRAHGSLHIIDALGPFVESTDRRTINWSKVIFSDLETDGRVLPATQKRIANRFERYVVQVANLGYDSLSIDDLAHLVSFDFYNPELQTLLGDYRKLYKKLFAIAKKHQLKLFINTDFLFLNNAIKQHLHDDTVTPADFFVDVLRTAFQNFPEIDGVILRIGENDGKDVDGTFLSKLMLRTPKQANALLQKILPIFEQHDKTLIFRTWTVGVYGIGDLIWNEKTFDTVFSSIQSNALIISMKYGDTDFMRYLSLNPLFFKGPHKKILELQTRREWEGMGTYPSFIGWDYADYLEKLADNDTVVGIHVWCQTGGWAKKEWSNVTYLDDSSFWNELNTEVTIGITRHGQSVEAAVTEFCHKHKIKNPEAFLKLLRLSDIALKKGLYLPEIARKPLYFRRSRIPSLMWLTWDRMLVSPIIIRLHRILLANPEKALQDSEEAVVAAQEMVTIASSLGLKSEVISSLQFEHATLILFAQLRHHILTGLSESQLAKLNKQIRAYERKYPQHYSIPHLPSTKPQRRLPRSSLGLFLRETLAYRKRDRIMLKTSPIQAKAVRFYMKRSKSHLADQSMGFEVFFK